MKKIEIVNKVHNQIASLDIVSELVEDDLLEILADTLEDFGTCSCGGQPLTELKVKDLKELSTLLKSIQQQVDEGVIK